MRAERAIPPLVARRYVSSAVGLAFLGDLARQRSLASAALLFLVLVDEIEGLVFLALGALAHRMDLFLSAQDALFPAVIFVAGAASLVRNWRRRLTQDAPVDPVEMLDAIALTERIGVLRSASLAANPRGAAISLYARSHERTSRRG